jgi:stage V sporulation protein G
MSKVDMGNKWKVCEVVSMRMAEGLKNIRAFSDIRIGGSLIIKGVTVVDGKNGLFVSMPSKVGKDGKWRDSIFVADDELSKTYKETVIKAYKEAAGI